MARRFVGRWLDRDGVIHIDNPRKRKQCAVGWRDPQANAIVNVIGPTWFELGLERNPCGRSSAALWKYEKRSTVPTCLACVAIMLKE